MSLAKQLKHRLEWLLVRGGFALFGALPMETASNIGAWVARILGPYLKVTQVARRNLRRAFPEWTEEKITETIEGVWDGLGRYAAEFPHIASLSAEAFAEMTEVVGMEQLAALAEKGQPALFFSCHMANWELGAKAAWAVGAPVSIVYRPLNNRLVDALVNSYRDQYQKSGIPKTANGSRELLKGLKNGDRFAILIDQKMRPGIPVPFFGHDAMTSSSVADLALRYGYPILPARIERIGRTPRFRVTVYPPVEYTQTGDHAADAKAIMQTCHNIMESWIRERPEQWFWLHKRWG